MPVEIKTVSTRKELKAFIFLPEKIHTGHSNWVPPFYEDEWKFYDPVHNRQLLHADTVLFLAIKDQKNCGRIMGIIHRSYNHGYGPQVNSDSYRNWTQIPRPPLHRSTSAEEERPTKGRGTCLPSLSPSYGRQVQPSVPPEAGRDCSTKNFRFSTCGGSQKLSLTNKLHGESTARFFNFDCFDDAEVSDALLSAVEKWALAKGMTKITGPFGFSDKDPQGLQVEGFEHLPVLATPVNHPYLPRLLEKKGYQKEVDCVVYALDVPEKIPDYYRVLYQRVIRNKNIRLVEFSKKKQLKPYIVPVLKLVNETYRDLYGFIPMDEEEMYQLAGKYLPMLDPAFTKLIVDSTGDPIAFVIASPDISEGIKKARGRIWPFGFIHILLSAKKSKQLDLFLGAVKDSYQGKGLTAILGVSLMEAAIKRGLKTADSHLILETNKSMRNVMERLGATVYKRYRIYKKELNSSA